MMATTLGIDVSKHQGNVDWSKVPGNPDIKFAYSRASLGKSDKDATFKTNYDGSKAAGLLRGAYHAFWPGRTGQEQFDNFFGAYSPQGGDLVPMIDVEKYDNSVSIHDFLKEVVALLELTTHRVGKKPFLYTANWFWESIGNPPALADYPLWVAYYNPDPAPTLPKGWPSYVIWQYTDKGHVPGVTDNTCDMDRFQGTLDDLKAYQI
jgi:lysozyme